MSREDPYKGWITIRQLILEGYSDQYQIECRCGFRREAVGRHVAAELAGAHVAEHGVSVPRSYAPLQPVVSMPAGPSESVRRARYAASLRQGGMRRVGGPRRR